MLLSRFSPNRSTTALLLLALMSCLVINAQEKNKSGYTPPPIKAAPLEAKTLLQAAKETAKPVEQPVAPAPRFQAQEVRSVTLPAAVDFAGEDLPMDNFDVAERLDRELMINTFRHSATMSCIKLANRYFPVIEPILAEYGIPDDFKYLAVAESDLRYATSSAGAKGIWQFMPGTAQAAGLVVNGDIDERNHLEKSTRAACQYLRDAYNQFGSWILAAASYNMGRGGLAGDLNAQRGRTYFDLNLNAETDRYVFRIVAFKLVMTQPEYYGYFVSPSDLYQPIDRFTTVEVSGAVNSWADFAIQHNITYRELKVFNPWIMTGSMKNREGNTYTVKIPID